MAKKKAPRKKVPWHWICEECTTEELGFLYRTDGKRTPSERCCFCGGPTLNLRGLEIQSNKAEGCGCK